MNGPNEIGKQDSSCMLLHFTVPWIRQRKPLPASHQKPLDVMEQVFMLASD